MKITTRSAFLLFLFFGLILYANVLLNNFVGDDFEQIVNNPPVHSIYYLPRYFLGSTYASGQERLKGIFYRPVMLSVFSIIYQIFGSDALYFHLLQILLHIANVFLLYLFLNYFFSEQVSFILSLIFLIHPINNEAVVYIANLQEELYFFFGILGLLSLRNRGSKIAMSGVLFFLSLLSKESGIIFLLMANLFSFFFAKKKWLSTALVSFFVLCLYLLMRFGLAKMYLSQGSVAPIYNAPFLTRLINIPAIFFYYLSTFLLPIRISSSHFFIISSFNLKEVVLPLTVLIIFLLFILIAADFIFKKNMIRFRHFIFFVIWFFAGISIHFQIIPLDATVADRWFYFPIIGLLAMGAIIIEFIRLPKIEEEKKPKPFIFAILSLVIIMLMTRSWIRNSDWRNDLTWYGHDIKVTRKNFVLDNSYGAALISASRFGEAKPYILASVKAYPYYANLNNLAIIYVVKKKYIEADYYLKKSIEVSNSSIAYENYAAFLLYYRSQLQEAELFTLQSLKKFPQDSRLWFTLAKIYGLEHKEDAALQAAKRSYSLSPTKEVYQFIIDLENKR